MSLFTKNKTKIFCIGQNKTGTTSLQKFFIDHGFKVGDQQKAELLYQKYISRDWKPILKYCKTADVFQDIPFSDEYLFIILDYYFPNSKFILTVRDSSDQWYNSITRFHSKLFGKDGNIPTKEDLLEGKYRYKGFIWETINEKFGDFEGDIYNKEHLIELYESRNNRIEKFFSEKNNFLKLNLSEENAIEKLATFVNVKPKYSKIPWENKTKNI